MTEFERKAKVMLRELLRDFEKNYQALSNQEYLEFQIQRLSQLCAKYESVSKDPSNSARIRARSRDLAMSTKGLIQGLKFGISFMLHQNVDLAKAEGLGDVIMKGPKQ